MIGITKLIFEIIKCKSLNIFWICVSKINLISKSKFSVTNPIHLHMLLSDANHLQFHSSSYLSFWTSRILFVALYWRFLSYCGVSFSESQINFGSIRWLCEKIFGLQHKTSQIANKILNRPNAIEIWQMSLESFQWKCQNFMSPYRFPISRSFWEHVIVISNKKNYLNVVSTKLKIHYMLCI